MHDTMTAGEALAWIAKRNEAFSFACQSESLTGVELHLLWDRANLVEIEKGHTSPPTYHALVHQLVMACRLGSVVATGVRQTSSGQHSENDKLEEIGTKDWETLWLADRGDEIVAVRGANEGAHQRSLTEWHSLHFKRADVIKAFPETSIEKDQVCAKSANSANSSERSDDQRLDPAPKRIAIKIASETDVSSLIEDVRIARDRLLATVQDGKADRGEPARRFFQSLERMFLAYRSGSNWPTSQSHPIVAIPPDIAVVLGGLCGYLAVGKVPEPIEDCIKGSGRTAPGPFERKDMEVAVAYVKAARAGDITDRSHIKTVAEAYGVKPRTVHDWINKFNDLSPTSVCDGELKLLPALMRKAGSRYQQAGRSSDAIRRRNAKQQS